MIKPVMRVFTAMVAAKAIRFNFHPRIASGKGLYQEIESAVIISNDPVPVIHWQEATQQASSRRDKLNLV